MRTDSLNTTGLRATLLALLVVVGAMLVWSVSASANPNKPYTIVICGVNQTGCSSQNPALTSPGGTTMNPSALTVTFTNDNKLGTTIDLGSDNLTVPSALGGFSVIGTSLQGCPTPSNQPCFELLNGGTTVGFRNLNLAPGQSISINISLVTPSPSATACTTSSPCSFTDVAKQSNDFNGVGNNLNPDANSSWAVATAAATSCPALQPCSPLTLADGGTSTGSPGSVSVTVNTSSGGSNTTLIEALDFGTPLDPSLCSGVTALHDEYWNLTGGSDRSQTVSITTTAYPGYQPWVCLFTSQPFTQVLLTNGQPTAVGPATPTTVDGTPGYQGLLPECAKVLPPPTGTVDCSINPGYLSRGVVNPNGTITTVIAIPPGYDAHSYQ